MSFQIQKVTPVSDSREDIETPAILEKSFAQEPAVSPLALRKVYVFAAFTLIIVVGALITTNSELVSLGLMRNFGWMFWK